MQAPAPSWWESTSAVGASLATIAVAVFAAVQLWRERMQRISQRRAAHFRVSATGYLVRRRLVSWIGQKDRDNHLESWLRDAQNSGTLEAEMSSGLADLRRMMDELGELSEPVADNVRRLYVHYLEGTRRLVAYAGRGRPSGIEIFDWIQLKTDAVEDFKDCVALLDDGIVEVRLLNTETLLARKRADEEPFGQMARIIAQESKRDE